MKKILIGTLAAAAVLGTVSVASAQTLAFPRALGEPVSYASDYQTNYSNYITSPDASTGNSVGYNLNIADRNNIGG